MLTVARCLRRKWYDGWILHQASSTPARSRSTCGKSSPNTPAAVGSGATRRSRSLLGWRIAPTLVSGSLMHPAEPLSMLLTRDQLRIVQSGDDARGVRECHFQVVTSLIPALAHVLSRIGEDHLDLGCHMRIMGRSGPWSPGIGCVACEVVRLWPRGAPPQLRRLRRG
jgi:hypothetical protein